MKSTFKAPNGEVLIVHESPARAAVWVTSINSEGARTIVAIPLHLAGVVAQAVEAAATMIEESCRPTLADIPALSPDPAWPLKPCQDMGAPFTRAAL